MSNSIRIRPWSESLVLFLLKNNCPLVQSFFAIKICSLQSGLLTRFVCLSNESFTYLFASDKIQMFSCSKLKLFFIKNKFCLMNHRWCRIWICFFIWLHGSFDGSQWWLDFFGSLLSSYAIFIYQGIYLFSFLSLYEGQSYRLYKIQADLRY